MFALKLSAFVIILLISIKNANNYQSLIVTRVTAYSIFFIQIIFTLTWFDANDPHGFNLMPRSSNQRLLAY